MARPRGFEPPTFRIGICCTILLCYGRKYFIQITFLFYHTFVLFTTYVNKIFHQSIYYIRGDFMTIKLKPLLINLFIPLAVGGLSALFTMNSMEAFSALNQPLLSPPGWLFPVVWTILFVLMGIAAYLVATSSAPTKEKRTAFIVYGAQLFFNFLWSIIFFNRGDFLFAFIWLIALWALIIANIFLFYRISKPAGLLLIPYLLWVTFAGYLNFAIYLLN